MGWLFKAMEELVWVAQLGFNILMPPVLCLGLCWWLVNFVGVGAWVYLPGFLLGLGGGAASFRGFARHWLARTKKEQTHTPAGFNRHR